MKKTLAVLLAALMLLALVPAVAEEAEAPVVYVTIANGELVAAQIEVELTDVDEDGALTIADALIWPMKPLSRAARKRALPMPWANTA